MAAGVRNHATEFVGDGRFVKAKVSAELRAEMDGVPLTYVSAALADILTLSRWIVILLRR